MCYASSSSGSLPDYDAKCVLYTRDGLARKDCDDAALPRVQPLNLSRYRLHAAAALKPPALIVLEDTPSPVRERDDDADSTSHESHFCQEVQVTQLFVSWHVF